MKGPDVYKRQVPLPDKDRARSKFGPFLVKAGETGGRCRAGFVRDRSIQHLPRCMIEVAEAISLEPIGDDRKQQVPRQMSRRWPLKHAQPASTKSTEVETAQMRDLVLN